MRTFPLITADEIEQAGKWSNSDLDERWCEDPAGQEDLWGHSKMPVLLYELIRRVAELDYDPAPGVDFPELPDEYLDAAYDVAVLTLVIDGFSESSSVSFEELFTFEEAIAITTMLRALVEIVGQRPMSDWARGMWSPHDRESGSTG